MSRLAVGRIGRSTYWMLIVALVILKIMVSALLGSSASAASVVLIYFVMAARFQDFGAPAWLAGTLLGCILLSAGAVVLVYASSQGGPVDPRSLPQAAQVALLLPELLLTLVAGTVPGHAGKNRFGPPNQGLAGVIPRRVGREEPEAPPADRIARVVTRASRRDEPATSGVVLNRSRARRGASVGFGRR